MRGRTVGKMEFLEVYRKIAKKAMRKLKHSTAEEIATNPLGQRTIKADRDLEKIVLRELKALDCAVASEEIGLKKFSQAPQHLFVVDPLDASENFKRGMPCYALGIARAKYGGTFADVEDAYVFDLVSGDEFYSQKGKGAWRNGKEMKPSKLENMKDSIVVFDFYNSNGREISDSTRAMVLKNTKDIRRYGPALLEMAYVACGAVEGYFNVNSTLSVVHASGVALMRDAGCTITDHEGKQLDFQLEDLNKYFTIVAGANAKIHAEMMKIAKG
ncbi:MAG: inositol monophosphatase family protein [Candidatus Micrarchaeia archaeon]